MILPIVLVTLQGANANVVRDVDNANAIWSAECRLFVDVLAELVVDRVDLLVLDQNDCVLFGHVVWAEEDALYDFGRGRSDLVGYYIQGDVAGFAGCAAHPSVDAVFGLETALRHGRSLRDDARRGDHFMWATANLMFTPTASITNPPLDLTDDQCRAFWRPRLLRSSRWS